MLFSYGSGQQQIDNNEKWVRIAGDFDCHGDVAVRRRADCPIEHIQGFNRSYWMSPLVKCLHRIALAATMVNAFE